MGRQTVASVPMILALLHLYSSIRCTSHAKKENHTLYTAIAQIRKKRERERERERERKKKRRRSLHSNNIPSRKQVPGHAQFPFQFLI